MANMLRHRNTPYSCQCCFPYYDKRESSRAYENRMWHAEVDDELLWMDDSMMYDVSKNVPTGWDAMP